MKTFVGKIKQSYFTSDNSIFQEYLDKIRGLKVLVIGDVIIDEYVYCNLAGISFNEKVPVYEFIKKEIFAGGVLAVANHIAGFCDDVTLVTRVGNETSRQNFINANLRPNIQKCLFNSRPATLAKQRFIDPFSSQRVFKLNYPSQEILCADKSAKEKIKNYLVSHLAEYDLVVAADFGHGLLNVEFIPLICGINGYLALTVQTNPTNFGFNLVSKYPNANYLCINELELRLATANKFSSVKDTLLELSKKIRCDKIAVTLGKKGALIFEAQKATIFKIPSFLSQVKDAVGAGDTFFSVTALFTAVGAPTNLLGFIGSAAGSWAVGVIGNKIAIQADDLEVVIKNIIAQAP